MAQLQQQPRVKAQQWTNKLCLKNTARVATTEIDYLLLQLWPNLLSLNLNQSTFLVYLDKTESQYLMYDLFSVFFFSFKNPWCQTVSFGEPVEKLHRS